VGRDHAPWLAREKGELGMAALRALFHAFDPDGRMNPGKLVTP
jgi:alkyldihydroxyacetonephosphate synthase